MSFYFPVKVENQPITVRREESPENVRSNRRLVSRHSDAPSSLIIEVPAGVAWYVESITCNFQAGAIATVRYPMMKIYRDGRMLWASNISPIDAGTGTQIFWSNSQDSFDPGFNVVVAGQRYGYRHLPAMPFFGGDEFQFSTVFNQLGDYMDVVMSVIEIQR